MVTTVKHKLTIAGSRRLQSKFMETGVHERLSNLGSREERQAHLAEPFASRMVFVMSISVDAWILLLERGQ